MVNIDSPFHHGHKYEPLSQLYYEYIYKTIISSWGCLQHIKYNFIGASPDGLNSKKNNVTHLLSINTNPINFNKH